MNHRQLTACAFTLGAGLGVALAGAAVAGSADPQGGATLHASATLVDPSGAEIGWGFDWFYQRVVVRPYRQISAFLSSVFAQQGIDGILVDGLPQLLSRLSTTLRTGQSGFIRNYAWVFFFGVIVLVGYFIIR